MRPRNKGTQTPARRRIVYQGNKFEWKPGTIREGRGVVYYVTVQGTVYKRHENQLRTRFSEGQEEGFRTLFDLCDHPSRQTTPQLNPSVGPSEAVQLQTHEPAVEPPPIVPDVMTRPRRIRRYPKKLF
ncbi:hypothetical protein Ciccas_008030 [Cichlidogyrus casuarinus]|uniref:Uncharacterized protein n=1 Tax=Cichlidogyrus casuarinus TaxID=1844966 RepID=A0ABD2Q193_9PLAT